MIKITTTAETPSALTISISGELDTISATDAEQQFREAAPDMSKTITIDLSQLNYISSSGLRFLLGVHKAASSAGGKLHVEGLNSMVAKIFALTGFDKLFN
jgi:anti-anti-sigma factor